MTPTLSRHAIAIDADTTVDAIAVAPTVPLACYVLAHGAGAGMTHPFMGEVAGGLAERGLATLRYQFAYMQRGSRRPDRPPLAHAAVRAAVAAAAAIFPSLPLLAGGKSFGGRMTSQAQALQPLAGVHGLVFLGFPLHPPGKPSTERAAHLRDIALPMLFLQGTRDEMADIELLRSVTAALPGTAALVTLTGADHSFHVPAKSGRNAVAEALDALAAWAGALGLGTGQAGRGPGPGAP